MKKNFVFAVFLSLFVFAVAASAQTAPSFTGTWSLDIPKSTLDDRAKSNTESQTMTVAEKDNTITITTATKRPAPPADAPQGGRPGGGQGRGGFGGGDGTTTYTLDGKEVKTETDGPMGKMPTTLKGKLDGGKLHLERSSTFSGQMGEVTISTKDVWELSADGKALTVSRDSVSPRGSTASKWVYNKGQ